MVREANMKQAASEKQLKEAWGKVRSIPVCLGQPKSSVTVLDGVYCPQLARACNRALTDPHRHQEQENPGLGQAGWV